MKIKQEHENIKKILPTTIFQSSALVNLNLVGTVSAVILGPNFSIKALTGISPAGPHQHVMLKWLFLITASLVILNLNGMPNMSVNLVVFKKGYVGCPDPLIILNPLVLEGMDVLIIS